MKKLLTIVLLGFVTNSAFAVDIQDTLLPQAIEKQYAELARKNMLDKAPREFIELYESIQQGNYDFSEDALTKSIPQWRLILNTTRHQNNNSEK